MGPVLRVSELVKSFPRRRRGLFGGAQRSIRAVDGVSFELRAGETLALVGETGCGKSTLARCLVRLVEPTSGTAHLDDQEIFAMSRAKFRPLRRDIQMVFQDPYSSLNPRKTVRQLISEAWSIYPDLVKRSARKARSDESLRRVGLESRYGDLYPHQLSGGQRQRVAIARALAVEPKVIVCDEPVAALDASIQAQILNLMKDLQRESGIAYLFIAHDLATVAHLADQVAVMYLGKIVEIGSRDQVLREPLHPYTQALMSAHPDPDPWDSSTARIVLAGDVPDPADPPSGCHFRTRCWKAASVCSVDEPKLETRGLSHPSACHFASPELGTHAAPQIDPAVPAPSG
jgi:oligopeptide/dipeptide ABC transporter ATP-binding protein